MLRGYREEKQVALKPINEDVCECMCMCFTEEVKKKKREAEDKNIAFIRTDQRR